MKFGFACFIGHNADLDPHSITLPSNPLSIESGDVILIPDVSQMQSNFINPEPERDENTAKLQLNKNKPTLHKDKLRIEYLKKKNENSSQLLPPNFKSDSAQNIKFKDGKIVFGEDVTNYNKADCPVVLTRARVKERLLNKKIFS